MDDSPPPLLRTRRGLVFTALPAIAVLAALGALLAVAHRNSAIRDRKDEIRSLAAAAATNVSRFAGDQLATLGAAAVAPSVRRGNRAAIRAYVHDVAVVGRFSAGVGYIDRSLMVRAASGGLPNGRPFSARTRAYARTALRSSKRVVS